MEEKIGATEMGSSNLRIALYGPIGGGKTGTTKQISEMFEGVKVFSFAAALKDLAVGILGRPINKATDRLFLAHLGQGMRSELIKFLGLPSLMQLLMLSIDPDACYSNALEEDAFHSRMFAALSNFAEKNPEWGQPAIWANIVIKQVEQSDCKIALVDDLRFKNEYALLLGAGFTFAKVSVEPDARKARIVARDGKFNPDVDLHPSELEWVQFPDTDNIIHTSCLAVQPDPLAPLDITDDVMKILERIGKNE